MTFTFRPAVREGVGLIIGLAGGTGSGKTYSAMELATGLAGGKRFAVIDTEAGRAKHYADRFAFDHGDLRPPFRPDAYAEAIAAADTAGYPVIVVDSASHEHAGDGGLLDWHEEILVELVERKRQLAEKKGWEFSEWREREASTMRAWIEPKKSHKRYMQKLLQLRAHIVLCFRAEPKIEMAKEDGKTVVREKQGPTGARGWFPVCEKNLPFEATASFLLLAEQPGKPIPIKLQEQHRAMFPADKPISRATGEALARWARGGTETAPGQTAAIGGAMSSQDAPGPSPGLDEVLRCIGLAQSESELKLVSDAAKKLPDAEQAQAREKFKARANVLRQAARAAGGGT